MTTATSRSTSGAPAASAAADRPFIWVNGEMKPKSQAMVSVYDHGLLYGDGIFEGIRVYQGKIFLCKQHIERLWKCASDIRMTIPISKDEMVSIMRKCIEANGLKDGYIRLVVTRGAGTLGLDPRRCPVPGIICIADQISLFPAQMYDEGMRVVVANRPKTPVACLDPRIKSLNYLNNILAKCEAIDYGCHEVIMLNLDGEVTEGSGDNIFMIEGGQIFTPPSDDGLLEGITRKFVMQRLAPECGYKVVEKSFRLDELLKAEEIFLTGSAAEIISVTQIDQHDGKAITKSTRISQGEGPITNKLRQKFRQIVTSANVPED